MRRHQNRVAYACVSKLSHSYFRHWLATRSSISRYLNWWGIITNWALLETNFSEILINMFNQWNEFENAVCKMAASTILTNDKLFNVMMILQSTRGLAGNKKAFTCKEWEIFTNALKWRHNECDCVSNHQPHHCLLNHLFGRRSNKTSKLRVTGLCAGNSPGTGEFPAQMASKAENASIWWRHHGYGTHILFQAPCTLSFHFLYYMSVAPFYHTHKYTHYMHAGTRTHVHAYGVSQLKECVQINEQVLTILWPS